MGFHCPNCHKPLTKLAIKKTRRRARVKEFQCPECGVWFYFCRRKELAKNLALLLLLVASLINVLTDFGTHWRLILAAVGFSGACLAALMIFTNNRPMISEEEV